MATKMLSDNIRQDIYNIYGFVRFADEIVDTFHNYDKAVLFEKFSNDLEDALEMKISLNPILNSFQETYHKYNIEKHMVDAFMKSMHQDLYKQKYLTPEEYKDYIYGSADVVGLMCLKVFVKGDEKKYNELKDSAMSLGSAFQKVNFLRDLKDDYEVLNRSYFPNIDLGKLDAASKDLIIEEIEADFEYAFSNGILNLPAEAKFGVYMAYRYYRRLLKKLHKIPSEKIMDSRIRISDPMKINLLARSYVKYKLNII